MAADLILSALLTDPEDFQQLKPLFSELAVWYMSSVGQPGFLIGDEVGNPML